jgi:hypothetical protein
LFVLLWHAPSAAGAQALAPAGYGSIDNLATKLFSDYLISFEITSVLLLAAIVGAIALARRAASPQATASRTIGAQIGGMQPAQAQAAAARAQAVAAEARASAHSESV